MNGKSPWQTIWSWLCSLKLAIVLASLVTLVSIGGSLLIPFYPQIFGDMDAVPLGQWLATVGSRHPAMSGWLWLSGGAILLLGINTACCFIEWLRHLRSRWRKTGEYLLHLGFILVLGAYVWGSLAGFRSDGTRLAPGQTIAVPNRPGLFLRLDASEPILNADGRPMDMRSQLTLLRGDAALLQREVRANHPLLWRDLTVLTSSFDRINDGFRFSGRGRDGIELREGSRLPLPGGSLTILRYLPQAFRLSNGRVVAAGPNPVDPALLCEITVPGQPPQRSWYFLREPPPTLLVQNGWRWLPQGPLYIPVAILTINHDPGLDLALAGAGCMTLGVCLALLSFYYKRKRGDRPQL